MSLAEILVLALAVEATVEIFLHSDMPLIRMVRDRLQAKGPDTFIGDLTSCGWCLSVWAAGGLYGLWALGLGWVLVVLAGHRLANFVHFGWGLLRKARFKNSGG